MEGIDTLIIVFSGCGLIFMVTLLLSTKHIIKQIFKKDVKPKRKEKRTLCNKSNNIY